MHRFRQVLISLFACALIAASQSMAGVDAQTAAQAPSPAPAQTTTIYGTATDTSGKPLGGVVISLDGPVKRSTTTATDGTYSFDGVPIGIYTIGAARAGYQPAVLADFAVGAQNPRYDVQLVPESLSSLRVIGSVRSSSSRSTFNATGQSVTTVGGDQIANRQNPNLGEIASELPGVTVSMSSGGRDPNESFVVRGSSVETKVNIDGHPLSSGVFGTYFTQYANSDVFQQVEVVKGAGLNGPNAGESAVGTVNLRTRDFASKDEGSFKVAQDSYNGGAYSLYLNLNFLKDNRLQLLGVHSFQGFNGTNYGVTGNELGVSPLFTSSYGASSPSLISWQGGFADPYTTIADLAKIRYKFSSSTWLTGEYLGLFGRFNPQGGSYGLYYGSVPVAQCYNVANTAASGAPKYSLSPVAAGGTGCNDTSIYNPPYAQNLIGQTVNAVGFFPNSVIDNNENEFSAELRTTLANDTILVRPYVAEILRSIDGTYENQQPGYGTGGPGSASSYGGWYQVTNVANCQTQFVYNNAPGTGGSKGPCFSAANGYTLPYIGTGATQPPVVFPTTATAPACSAAAPCYTTPTNSQVNGYYGYSTPFSQPEVDRIRGATFSYLHPVKDDLFAFTFDYNLDDTLKFSGDTSPLPAGCFSTIGSASNAATINGMPNPYYQPACTVNGQVLPTLPRTGLQIPPTQNLRFDTGLTGLIAVTPSLQLGLGAYYSLQKLYYQVTDPNAAAAAANAGENGAEQANATLEHGVAVHGHFDPHVQVEYRATRDLSLRANGGSSVTFPYAGITSGFTTLNPNSGSDGKTDSLSAKNPELLPETTVAYDFGLDYRLPEASVLSMDAYDNTIHNVWVTTLQVVPNLPGRNPSMTTLSQTLNGPLERSYGLELTLQRTPVDGIGYFLTASADRAYYDQFGTAFYKALGSVSAIVNGKQLDGTTGFTAQIPYFKADGNVNYTAPSQRWTALAGDAFFGENNATGGPPYHQAYAYYQGVIGPGTLRDGLRLGLTVQNLFNYIDGSQLGNVYAYQGFIPQGVKYSAATGGLVPANPFSTPNGLVEIPARNVFLSLSKNF